jgi:hypothetical protein
MPPDRAGSPQESTQRRAAYIPRMSTPSMRDRLWLARQNLTAQAVRPIHTLRARRAGTRFVADLRPPAPPASIAISDPTSPLEHYFDSADDGPGIYKWRHYFPIYHRHMSKFVGREVHVVEIGIYSGGSLPMWRHYFGGGCQIYGIDIAPECRVHEQEGVRVFIGDQADPDFWARFCHEVPRIDVVIDDGGHQAHQQITSLECLLPHMAFGGVYVCEDIIGPRQQFNSFMEPIERALSDVGPTESNPARPWHQHIASVHRYPQVAVVERPDGPVSSFDSIRRGTVWEPSIRL